MPQLLITCECLPAGLLGCYGGVWSQTPAFDRLAAESLLLDRCFSASPLEAAVEMAPWQATRRLIAQVAHESRCPRWRLIGPSRLREIVEESSPRDAECRSIDWWFPSAESDALALQAAADELRTPSIDLSDSILWVALQGIDPVALSLADDAERLTAATAGVEALDAELGPFLSVWQERVRHQPGSVFLVCGLRGMLLRTHPLVAAGMPPLLDEVLQTPAWIHTADPAARGVRWPGLLSRDDLPALLDTGPFPRQDAAGSSGSQASSHWSASLQQRQRLEILTCYGTSAISLRTDDLRAILQLTSSDERQPGRLAEDETRLWMFHKPEDVWESLDVSSQRPDEAEELRTRLLDLLADSPAVR